ncbi:response regulator transcription factor [Streptomyces sp. KL2]|uniref:response regulator transcription factor n=1 Tax=Streptomyces sp. KL2 TaxID=3050126 RepID=UPI0039791663
MSEAATTRILLADDRTLVRRGVRLILDGEADLTVVAEAGDGAEAVEQARAQQPDLAVLDIAMRDEPFLHPGAVTALIRHYLDHTRDGITAPERLVTAPERLVTDREEEILELVAEGRTSQQTAHDSASWDQTGGVRARQRPRALPGTISLLEVTSATEAGPHTGKDHHGHGEISLTGERAVHILALRAADAR